MCKNRILTAVEAKKIMDTEDVIILDVRTEEEYAEKHLYDSICIPLNILRETVEQVIIDKNKKILIYCRSGRRSNDALKILLSMGYENVYDFGGILDWPFEVIM